MNRMLVVLLAGLAAGAMNAAAGGGSFVSVPALMYTGIPSVASNMSSVRCGQNPYATQPGNASRTSTRGVGFASCTGGRRLVEPRRVGSGKYRDGG